MTAQWSENETSTPLVERLPAQHTEGTEMPAPSTAAQATLLQAVWDLFYAASRWPTFAEIDRKLDRDHDIDIASVAPTLPPGLLMPPDLRYVRGSEPIRLSVAGAKACANSDEELKVFLASVRTAASKERAHAGSDSSRPELVADDLRQLPELPVAGRDLILLRVGMLLGVENWGWTSYAQGDLSTPNWSFSVGRDVRRLRAVQTLDDYWAITHPAPEEPYFQPPRSNERREGPTVTEQQTGADSRKVFVIHGRNDRARRGVFSFLRSIGLEPIEWSRAIAMTGRGSPYIGEVLNVAFREAQAVLVLQTPDDVAHLHESLTYPGDPDSSPQMQPRPNVLFEAGMALARNEDRTIIVELGQIRSFSDIHGRHVVRLDNSIEKRQDLATRLRTAGCSVDLDGADWHQEGDLTPPSPPGGGLPLGRKLPS